MKPRGKSSDSSDVKRQTCSRPPSRPSNASRTRYVTSDTLHAQPADGNQPLPLVTARIAQDKKLLSALAANEDGADLEALAQESQLNGGVVESTMEYLCTQNMAKLSETGHYRATKLTHFLLAPLVTDAVTHFHDNVLPALNSLNAVLSAPEKNVTAFQQGHRTSDDFYTWMETHPVQQGAFFRFMEAQFASLPTWLDVVEFQSEFAQDTTSKFPDLTGRVNLQDRPDVLAKALEVESLERMRYDFMTEQPVHGARAYYFRQIMHNHDDDTCVAILRAQLPAMSAHSVIIIDEKVLPDRQSPATGPPNEYTAGLNLAMKAMFNAQERREAHWRQLLDRAGLVIRDIKKFTEFNDAVIIAAKVT
ncbi:Uu.00g124700.m01.CDS01 [Anthostomella pinea]|uniref:Uu.00g124700.m01.CDS01 n=1 Tax=Anthostomella pinea TaxID=933095 RepID=A0AAI8VI68_9PEZI|nr:Uu.00g124700.m01.CDS01 [Anthostomella pinea]